MTIAELLTKLRACDERGSDEIEIQIARIVGLAGHVLPPDYTTSLDAALTLVPSGEAWRVQHDPGADAPYSAAVLGRRFWPKFGPKVEWCSAPTAALAVCIAALEARRK